MITHLTGRIQAREEGFLALEVHGVSFGLFMPDAHSCAVGDELSVHTYMHWNAEQGPTLFGFRRELDRKVFLMIISCSGIGPKIALSLLGDLGSERFLAAVRESNEKSLSSVNGIGAKKAEQIVVHLKHKVAKLITSDMQLDPAFKDSSMHNIAEVLQTLNYSRQEIAAAMNHLRQAATTEPVPFDGMMRKALSFLAKKI